MPESASKRSVGGGDGASVAGRTRTVSGSGAGGGGATAAARLREYASARQMPDATLAAIESQISAPFSSIHPNVSAPAESAMSRTDDAINAVIAATSPRAPPVHLCRLRH
jgi:hypothetical protein